MKKNLYLKEKVKSIEVKKKSISKLLREMKETGFQGRKLGEVLRFGRKCSGIKI